MKLGKKSSPSDELTPATVKGTKTAGLSHKAKSQAMDKQLILKPRLSEKTYGLSLSNNVFVFEVPGEASKQAVAAAVVAQFSVGVTNVNMTNVKGKTKRTVRKGGRPTQGQRSDIKKAFVTLKEGDSLPFFATEEDKDAKKKDKKADKKTAKKVEEK